MIKAVGTKTIPCAGGCQRTQPALQDNEYGQRSRVIDWICGQCHLELCGTIVGFHSNCLVDELLDKPA